MLEHRRLTESSVVDTELTRYVHPTKFIYLAGYRLYLTLDTVLWKSLTSSRAEYPAEVKDQRLQAVLLDYSSHPSAFPTRRSQLTVRTEHRPKYYPCKPSCWDDGKAVSSRARGRARMGQDNGGIETVTEAHQ
jgi:hypothetical protein